MSWLPPRTIFPPLMRWRYVTSLRPSQLRPRPSLYSPSTQKSYRKVYFFGDKNDAKATEKAAKKCKDIEDIFDQNKRIHMVWWSERIELCKKPSTVQLVKRLSYSNLLGLDTSLKNGSLKEGSLNWEMLQYKLKFPREVLLCRVGDFYEAIGIDACILVEYAGLNPFSGMRSDSIPRAGCPIMNLRQTLDDLTNHGYSVCIIEEVQGPTQARSRKGRFISGHAHPGSPYVFGLVGADHGLDFPEPVPIVGLSRCAKGYSIILVFETMKTFSIQDNLTEEALVTKLHAHQCHHLFLHVSLKNNSSGTCRWGEYGEGGQLWAACIVRHFEWFEGNPVDELLVKVKELYGLDDQVVFRNVTFTFDKRPRPIHFGTATQIGALPVEGIPNLLKVLLPPNCTGLPVLYIRDLLLNPPAYSITSTIQAACKLMSNVSSSIPEFTCISSSKLVKLLELKEANHIEFCRIKSVLDEILKMYRDNELKEILRLLMEPSCVATGLTMDFDTLVEECVGASDRIGDIVSCGCDFDEKVNSFPPIPDAFFVDMESGWRGRVKGIHMEAERAEIESAAVSLFLAVSEDFLPIVKRIRSSIAPFSGPRGEILYTREHASVWFKGKRFIPTVWAGTVGEEQIKQLKPAVDSKGRKVGEEWFTTSKVENALKRYHDAGDKAMVRVLQLLRDLSASLQTKVNIFVFASTLLIIAKALFCHVSEGRRRKWVFPTVLQFGSSEDSMLSKAVDLEDAKEMKIIGLWPYWLDQTRGGIVHNTVHMNSLFLLTGPNGGGKSSLLRSVCAAALLGICGFMIPAESAMIPHFDSIMLHMKSYDSPVDGKSSFQMEMSELRSVITQATSRSLILIDEICRGTETAKGTCIAASMVETLDRIGCMGVVSTHLHGILDLPLHAKKIAYKAMGTEVVDGRTRPTWKLIHGCCRESLAFETALREGIPEEILERAEELYLSVYSNTLPILPAKQKRADDVEKELQNAVFYICQRKLDDLYQQQAISEAVKVKCLRINSNQLPPPSTVGASSVYVMFRPDKKLYIGQTDDLDGRVRSHRSRNVVKNLSFLYFIVRGRGIACLLETLLINQLPKHGFQLSNVADGKHRNFGISKTPQM